MDIKTIVAIKKISSFDDLKEGEVGVFEDDITFDNNLFVRVNGSIKMLQTTVFAELYD